MGTTITFPLQKRELKRLINMLQVPQLVSGRAETSAQTARLQPPCSNGEASLSAHGPCGFLSWYPPSPSLLHACDYPPFCVPSTYWVSFSTQNPSHHSTQQPGGSVLATGQPWAKQFPFDAIQEDGGSWAKQGGFGAEGWLLLLVLAGFFLN